MPNDIQNLDHIIGVLRRLKEAGKEYPDSESKELSASIDYLLEKPDSRFAAILALMITVCIRNEQIYRHFVHSVEIGVVQQALIEILNENR